VLLLVRAMQVAPRSRRENRFAKTAGYHAPISPSPTSHVRVRGHRGPAPAPVGAGRLTVYF
jgi:hypothetical protein